MDKASDFESEDCGFDPHRGQFCVSLTLFWERANFSVGTFAALEHCWFSGRILACHAGDRGSIPRQCMSVFMTYKISFVDLVLHIRKALYAKRCMPSIVGSVVEFSPATRETGVRFPDNAHFSWPIMANRLRKQRCE